MSDWFVALLILWAYGMGYVTAHAINNQCDPFWRGFIDGLTLRRLWQRAASTAKSTPGGEG